MKSETTDPWTTFEWKIVTADADIAHVMMPLSTFRLKNVSAELKLPEYEIEYTTQPPVPNSFAGTRLIPVQGDSLRFYDVAQVDVLPVYKNE